MEELQKAIELQYQSKGIARCRYNALNKVFTFLKDYNSKDNAVFPKKSKEELKTDYTQYWNKKLKQSMTSINILVLNPISLLQRRRQTKKLE